MALQRPFLYPVDTDQFEQIRNDGKVYIDKTDMIYDLVKKYRYVFLGRPRRFGKSLMCNTLHAYFDGKRELFDGLKIAELETKWEKHPVLHFIMSRLKNCTIEEAKVILEDYIASYEKVFGIAPKGETPGSRFRRIIEEVAQKTGKGVVIILDEYDSPIMRLLHEPEQRDQMRMILREFYQVLKDEGQYIRFVFITGVTKFSQLSIFSELNNLKNISMLDEYSGICGITQEELNTTLRPCVEEFADRIGDTTEAAYAMLKKQYDGYHFSPNSKDVYAPFSLLNSLNDGEINNYWFESGTSASLMEHLKHYNIKEVVGYDGIKLNASQFSIPCEDAETPLPLLYQSGYLSIESYSKPLRLYTLHFPNEEVRNGMLNCLMPIMVGQTSLENDNLITSIISALLDGNLSQALANMRAYIAKIPYDIITKEEWADKEKRESFYKMLFYMVFSMVNSYVDCEVKSILGRADVVIQTATDVYILELKVDKSVEEALAQIDDRVYAIPWSADGRCITKCGVSISSEARNITHWRITDANGNILEETKF